MTQHPSFAAAVAQQIDLRDAVRQYRANETALRRLAQSTPTRNVGATERAFAHRIDLRETIELSLVLADQLDLVGDLTEERKLVERISVSRRHNIARPELQHRLTIARARIVLLLDAAGA